jgi:hypothetical protein
MVWQLYVAGNSVDLRGKAGNGRAIYSDDEQGCR